MVCRVHGLAINAGARSRATEAKRIMRKIVAEGPSSRNLLTSAAKSTRPPDCRRLGLRADLPRSRVAADGAKGCPVVRIPEKPGPKASSATPCSVALSEWSYPCVGIRRPSARQLALDAAVRALPGDRPGG